MVTINGRTIYQKQEIWEIPNLHHVQVKGGVYFENPVNNSWIVAEKLEVHVQDHQEPFEALTHIKTVSSEDKARYVVDRIQDLAFY